jgi:DNA-binding NarL/FixJ family response regulator
MLHAPVTSGPQVLEMIRSEISTQNIPVIFLTGKGDKESVMKVVSLKPNGYPLKSLPKDELLKAVNKFFVSNKW